MQQGIGVLDHNTTGESNRTVMFEPSDAGVGEALNDLPERLLLKQIAQTIDVTGENLRIATNASAMDAKQLVKVQALLFDVIKLCDANTLMLQNFQSGANNILEKVKVAYLYLLDGFPDFTKNEIEAIADDVRSMGEAVKKHLRVVDTMTENLDQTHTVVRGRYEEYSNALQPTVDGIHQTKFQLRNIPSRPPMQHCKSKPLMLFLIIAFICYVAAHYNGIPEDRTGPEATSTELHSHGKTSKNEARVIALYICLVSFGFVVYAYTLYEWKMNEGIRNIGSMLLICSTWFCLLLTAYNLSPSACVRHFKAEVVSYECDPASLFYIVFIFIPIGFFTFYSVKGLETHVRHDIYSYIQIVPGPLWLVGSCLGLTDGYSHLFLGILTVSFISQMIIALVCIVHVLRSVFDGDVPDGSDIHGIKGNLSQNLRRLTGEYKSVHRLHTLTRLTDVLLQKTGPSLDSISLALRHSTELVEKWYTECKMIVEPSMDRTIAASKAFTDEQKKAYWNSPAFTREAQKYICRWKALQIYCDDTRAIVREKRQKIEGYYTENLYPEDAVTKAFILANQSFPDIKTVVTEHSEQERDICPDWQSAETSLMR